MKTEVEIIAEFNKFWRTQSNMPFPETNAARFARFAFISGYRACEQPDNIFTFTFTPLIPLTEKNDDMINAEFEKTYTKAFSYVCKERAFKKHRKTNCYADEVIADFFHFYQACQQLNDERIAAKDAEIVRLREALEKAKETYPTKGHLDAWIIAKQALGTTANDK